LYVSFDRFGDRISFLAASVAAGQLLQPSAWHQLH
jgi:hypothetical protein